jgi:hypothetical protein
VIGAGQSLEHVAALAPSVYVVRSSIDIQAPSEKVWQQVIAFTQIAYAACSFR